MEAANGESYFSLPRDQRTLPALAVALAQKHAEAVRKAQRLLQKLGQTPPSPFAPGGLHAGVASGGAAPAPIGLGVRQERELAHAAAAAVRLLADPYPVASVRTAAEFGEALQLFPDQVGPMLAALVDRCVVNE